MQQWRLRLQERVGPALEHLPLPIYGEMRASRVQDDLNIFPLQALADLEGLPEQMDIAVGPDLTDDGDPAGRNRQWLGRDEIPWRQLLQFALAATRTCGSGRCIGPGSDPPNAAGRVGC